MLRGTTSSEYSRRRLLGPFFGYAFDLKILLWQVGRSLDLASSAYDRGGEDHLFVRQVLGIYLPLYLSLASPRGSKSALLSYSLLQVHVPLGSVF